MNKKELIVTVAERLGYTNVETMRIYDTIESVIFEELKKGNKVSISGFGTFVIQSKPEKETINTFSKEKLIIPAKNEPKFKFSKNAKAKFN
ncbi:HU family DNA-binding protein [Mycoplasma phocoenae]|uniref:HU family DNA-binding protein n=1 Tax=Mycoplasma phocoenae TaxID=754517 RepID=A0A858U3I8_9MOLU|nr:HU family DNA-binding protein [Mycoplasma phocoenae]QJG66982.1 HU family DNA-binding protein [Mycoplasma phocoenae]